MSDASNRPPLLRLPCVLEERGNLAFLQEGDHVPFDIRRTYWIYDVPGGEVRGSHAFRNTDEMIIALSGSFEVVLNDGESETIHFLNRSYCGLYVPKLAWRTLRDFSTNSVALILASTEYDESDYIRCFDEFRREKANSRLS